MNNNQTNTASASASKKALTFEEDFKARAEKNLREKYELLTPPNPAKAMQSMLNPSENSKSLIQVPASSSSTAKSGKTIRNNIQGVLSKRLGPLNTKHLFDGIDDKSIENSIPTAQNVIKSNVSKGLLPKDYQNRFPNLLDGLSLSYAAAEKGNSKAATKAREAAYTETGVTSLAKKNNPLSSQNALPKPDTHFEDLFKAGKIPSLFSGFSNNSNQQKTSEKRYVGVQSGNLNLRSSPGASNTILDKMPRGTAVDFTGRKTTVDGNQWAEVVHNGNKGWVAADFLKTSKVESPSSLDSVQKRGTGNGIRFAAKVGNDSGVSVYSGDIWNNDTQKDLQTNDFSQNDLLRFYSVPENPTSLQKALMIAPELFHISENDLNMSEEDHIAKIKTLVDASSITNKDMKEVVNQLLNHFINGNGTDYSSPKLTTAVSNHSVTKKYIDDFSAVFQNQINQSNGNLLDAFSSKELKRVLKDNDVLLSKYNYSDIKDMLGGLTIAIHGWTENDVKLQSFDLNNDGAYSGVLEFTFQDNFGLDADDLPPEYALIPGFKSWFILQHSKKFNGKYKPFKTVVKIKHPISGKIKGYKEND